MLHNGPLVHRGAQSRLPVSPCPFPDRGPPPALRLPQVEDSDECTEHAKINFERSTFSSRAVNVRFNDEQFLLNDCVFFRVERVRDALPIARLLVYDVCVRVDACLCSHRSGPSWTSRSSCRFR